MTSKLSPDIIHPRGSNLLIREQEQEQETQTEGGLYLPKGATNDLVKLGVVVSAGPDCDWSVGTNVLYPLYAGVQLQLGGEEHRFMDQKDVLAWVGASRPRPESS